MITKALIAAALSAAPCLAVAADCSPGVADVVLSREKSRFNGVEIAVEAWADLRQSQVKTALVRMGGAEFAALYGRVKLVSNVAGLNGVYSVDGGVLSVPDAPMCGDKAVNLECSRIAYSPGVSEVRMQCRVEIYSGGHAPEP